MPVTGSFLSESAMAAPHESLVVRVFCWSEPVTHASDRTSFGFCSDKTFLRHTFAGNRDTLDAPMAYWIAAVGPSLPRYEAS